MHSWVLCCSQRPGATSNLLARLMGMGSVKQHDKVTLGTKGRTESGSVPFLCNLAGSSSCFSC